MHVRIRIFGKPDVVVVVESKLSRIEKFRRAIKEKFNVDPKLQRLFYGGKLLEDGYTFHDYNIKLNDVIQLMVRTQPQEISDDSIGQSEAKCYDSSRESLIEYKDAESIMYVIGDLVDVRDSEQGAWFEGKVARIVYDPNILQSKKDSNTSLPLPEINYTLDEGSDLENVSPIEEVEKSKKGIAKFFSKTPKSTINKQKRRSSKENKVDILDNEEKLLFKIQFDADDEDSSQYCKLKDIRPRAKHEIDVKDLKIGQKVMLNHNTEDSLERGYWYDFKIDEIKKLRSIYQLVGTLYLGPDAVPQNDTKVRVIDKIFAIEEVVPVAQRTDEYKQMMVTAPEKRTLPFNCMTCRDNEDVLCKDCGCYLCAGKEFPEKIVLCDECNHGYHMVCLTPPLMELPEEDWYCPSCKRDPNDVIAPGAAKQTKKASKSNRDWGRGMACAGKTKTSAMPPNHFGPIPGIEVGMCWRFRIQLSESGVHRPPVSGIHGRDVEGAYSIVLSGGYEDDVDYGNEFTYTGSGGRDLSGNKRTAQQSCDQTLTRENKALARNCAVKQVNEEGDDAGDNWRNGKPVRVVRSYKMMKHFPKYAPKEGIRYDGIYKVVKYYPERGLSGFIVWKYLLRRDDPCPAPWEDGAKQYSIVYPDGYLEAEAEKKALKEKNIKTKTNGKGPKKPPKRALRESNQTSESEYEPSPPVKKRKTIDTKKNGKEAKTAKVNDADSPKTKIASIFTRITPKKSKTLERSVLSPEEMNIIDADTINSKLWQECIIVCETRGRKEFIEYVTQMFLCIICQEVAVNPVTTPCLHNFCMACIKLAYKSTDSQNCPCCRQSLAKYEPHANEHLTTALRAILSGYDAGKK